jgi:hypothetical protein
MRSDVLDIPGRSHGVWVALAAVLALIVFAAGGPVRTVPAGHVGVKDFFGQVSSTCSRLASMWCCR